MVSGSASLVVPMMSAELFGAPWSRRAHLNSSGLRSLHQLQAEVSLTLCTADHIGHPGGPWSLTGPGPRLQVLWMPQVSEGVSNGTKGMFLSNRILSQISIGA